MISYTAFYDELEKIAAKDDRFVTKDKIKRHLKTVAATGVGAAGGAGVGEMIRRYALSSNLKSKIPKKALPIATAVIGGLAGLSAARHRGKVDKYIKEGK